MADTHSKTIEDAKKKYAYDQSKYNSNMGLRDGRVNELRIFFHVIPGHEEAMRRDVIEFSSMPGRRLLSTNQLVGAHTQVLTPFDNGTRFLFAVDFDTEWDPYIEDSLTLGGGGIPRYWTWWRHTEEFSNFSDDHLPTVKEAKFLMNVSRETAIIHVNAFPHLTVADRAKQDELWKAFQKVIDSPEGGKALAHPALKPLLDLAAAN